VAEECTNQKKWEAVRLFLLKSNLLQVSGNMTSEAHSQLQSRFVAYAMVLDKLLIDDEDKMIISDSETAKLGIRKPRCLLFPTGYFPHTPKRSELVSKILQIGHLEMFYLREKLGRESFESILKAFDMLRYPQQTISPIEPDWECEGYPDVGNFCAVICTAPTTFEPICIAPDDPTHPFHRICVCRHCQSKQQRLELVIYQTMKQSNIRLPQPLQDRSNFVEQCRTNHNQNQQRRRQKDIEDRGEDPVRLEEQMKSANYEDLHPRVRVPPAALDLEEDDDDDADYDKMVPTKKSFRCRKIRDRTLKYDPYFFHLMEDATYHLTQAYGVRNVYWGYVVQLFDTLLVQEHQAGRLKTPVEFIDVGDHIFRPKYLCHEYTRAASKYLDMPTVDDEENDESGQNTKRNTGP
jgi:hypothetical protein